jgi:hypothetical protein
MKRNSDHNSTMRTREFDRTHVEFIVRPTPMFDDLGMPVIHKGHHLHKDATGQKFVVI